MTQNAIIYVLEYNLSGFNKTDQLTKVQNYLNKTKGKIYVLETIIESISSLDAQRPSLKKLLNNNSKVDIIIISSIYCLGTTPYEITIALRTLSESNKFFIVEQNLSNESSLIEFLKIFSQIKQKCKTLKFKETISRHKQLSNKSLIGRPKLSSEIQKEVLYLRGLGFSYTRIVNRIGIHKVSRSTVCRIIRSQNKGSSDV